MATLAREALKDADAERVLFRGRARWMIVLMGLCIGLLAVRLHQLQVVDHERYQTASNQNRIDIEPVPPVRGLISDRNGVLLAENRAAFSLQLIPERVPDVEATLLELSRVVALDEDDLNAVREQIRRQRRFERAVVRSYLSDQEAAAFAAQRHRFPGVDLYGELVRHYPFREAFGHVIGYVGRISQKDLERIDRDQYRGSLYIGKAGVERTYESVLHGQVGLQQSEVDAHGRSLRILDRDPPTPGRSLRLSLDADLQLLADAALGANRGAVVAIDPRDGAVLALVSKPAFDPNLFVTGIDQASYDALNSRGRALFNRALQGQYPPGSTLKPFIAIAGLHDQRAAPQHRVYCNGAFQLPGRERKYRCWKRQGHGHLNLADAIKHSCDIYFYHLAVDLGIQRLHDHLVAFGLGAPTGIDLPGEGAGLVPSADWKRAARGVAWYPGETVIAGIGQGYHLTTPLQLAVATAVLATRGTLRVPTVVDGQALPPLRILNRGELHWAQVIGAMEAVMQSPGGTAYATGQDAPYRFAGKTGTAQVYGLAQDDDAAVSAHEQPEALRDHALFIGFAPADDPRIAIAVVVENGGSGSRAAAPVARTVIDRWLEVGPS
ncbi:MAG: penicillin-binding protein 2 [Pseudomonadota bacterium]|nr:penicillin-binding protein 2 [Pseudomonadota bacterium]